MSLTLRQIARAAKARVTQVTNEFPYADAVAYRRITVRQQQLMALASKTNPEYYGTSIVGTLTAGALDLRDVVAPVPTPEDIDDIQVANPGTSAWPAGTSISIVPLIDPASAIPPRATLRDGVLRQVGTELAGITSLVVYCARRGPTYEPSAHGTIVEIESPHDELLVIDLARQLLAQSPQAATPAAVALLTALGTEEQAAIESFLSHVRDSAPMQARFGVGH